MTLQIDIKSQQFNSKIGKVYEQILHKRRNTNGQNICNDKKKAN